LGTVIIREDIEGDVLKANDEFWAVLSFVKAGG
jgi:hypothetical protein